MLHIPGCRRSEGRRCSHRPLTSIARPLPGLVKFILLIFFLSLFPLILALVVLLLLQLADLNTQVLFHVGPLVGVFHRGCFVRSVSHGCFIGVFQMIVPRRGGFCTHPYSACISLVLAFVRACTSACACVWARDPCARLYFRLRLRLRLRLSACTVACAFAYACACARVCP